MSWMSITKSTNQNRDENVHSSFSRAVSLRKIPCHFYPDSMKITNMILSKRNQIALRFAHWAPPGGNRCQWRKWSMRTVFISHLLFFLICHVIAFQFYGGCYYIVISLKYHLKHFLLIFGQHIGNCARVGENVSLYIACLT